MRRRASAAVSTGNSRATSGTLRRRRFSLQNRLVANGDGGAIFTDDEELDIRLRSMRMQGSSPKDKYDNISIGLNSRLDSIQAAVLLPKLHAFIEHELNDVRLVASRYTEGLNNRVVTPVVWTAMNRAGRSIRFYYRTGSSGTA
jgi:dTDP-4-amino-4,6-dideoxygalactose transaminase